MKKLACMLLLLCCVLCLTTCAQAEPEPEPDYLAIMAEAASKGDVKLGRDAETLRALSAENAQDSEFTPVSFDELYLLSRYIYFKYGSWRCSTELRMCAGEVVLNRVASPEYPDSMEEVIFQEGQINAVDRKAFLECIKPSAECVNAALRLLLGERLLEPSVVLETDYPASNVYAMFCDRLLGNTYFYRSENLELYTIDEISGE